MLPSLTAYEMSCVCRPLLCQMLTSLTAHGLSSSNVLPAALWTLRLTRQKMRAARAIATAAPPTVPPTIAPVLLDLA